MKHGIIQKLEINIPWATLLHNPVKISISGVFLDVGPMDLTKVSKKEELQRYFNEKLQKLKMIDQYFELSSTVDFDDNKSDDGLAAAADSEEANQSYLQQWTTKIIDNIEITVSNVHFRYEEDPSSSSSPSPSQIPPPGVTPFACGITIEALGIATCNELWNQIKSGNHTSDNNNTNKAAVSTTAPASSTQTNSNNNSNSCVNKLAYLKGFGIYWQENIPSQQSFASLPPKLWEKMMLEFISKTTTIAGMNVITNLNDSNRAKDTIGRSNTTGGVRGEGGGVGGGSIHHILSPYNSNLTLKLRHHRKPTPMTAQVEIEAVSGKLQISIDSVVYVHLFSVLDRVAAMGKLHEPTTIRPMERPSGSREACRMWWKYAMKLVIKMKRYIELIKLAHSLSGGKKDPVSYLPPISALIVRELEIKLPFESLSVGRQRAIWELHEEAKQRERLRQAQGWGWGGWLGGASAPIETATASRDTTSMDISIESIIGELNKKYSTNIASNSKSSTVVPTTTLSFNLDSSASLLISSRGVPIIHGSAALSIHLLRTSSAGMTFSCDLHDFYIKDEFSTDPTLPYLLAVKSNIYPTMLPLRRNVPPSTHLQNTSSDDNSININGTSGSSSSSIKTATLSLRYEKSNAKSKVTMSSLPMELVLNKDCIQMLINAFQRPVNIYASNKGKRKRSSRRDNHRNSDTQQQHQSSNSIFQAARIFNQIVQKHNADDDVLEVVLEAHAPKIIIPESSSTVGDHRHHRHHGYLLIDCGYFQLNGLSSSSGISLDLSLQEVCVGMPISIADMYTLGEKSLYLIKVSTVIQ